MSVPYREPLLWEELFSLSPEERKDYMSRGSLADRVCEGVGETPAWPLVLRQATVKEVIRISRKA
jgi:hypothetical protein